MGDRGGTTDGVGGAATSARRTITSALTPGRAALAAVLVAAVVAHFVSPDIPFDSDEANHANPALRQFQDLAGGNLLDFLRHSWRTGQFPFFHGWTVLPWFAAMGTTIQAARTAQVALFVLGTLATGLAARRAARALGFEAASGAAGGLAGALFALSPSMAAWSGLCMLETPGAAWTAVSLATFAAACDAAAAGRARRATVLDVATAAAVLATYFTKVNYGLWIAPAIGLGYVVRVLGPEGRRAALRSVSTYAGVLAAAGAVWYSSADHRADFGGFLTNPPQAVPVVADDPAFRLPGFSTENFLAYFGLVASEAHLHWALGALVLAAAAAGVLSGARRRDPVVVAAGACVAWTWISLSFAFREYAMARFIGPALPALWICAAAGAAPLLAKIPATLPARAAERTLLLGGFVAQALLLPDRLLREYEVGHEFRPVFEALAAAIPRPASVMVVNWTDHASPRTLVWELGSRPGTRVAHHDVKGLTAERVYESDAAFDRWMDEDRAWGEASWASVVVEMVPGPAYPDRAVVVPETVGRWRGCVARRADRLELATSLRFRTLDLTVKVWRDRSPPRHLGLGAGR